MSDHFRFYPNANDTITPWNARYDYPQQSNAARKVTPRIPPVNGSEFSPSTAPFIRLLFPAQGYINTINTTLEFDVALTGYGGGADYAVRFQNNIQSIFKRVRLLYGSSPVEDILEYGYLVRQLTEWTSTNPNGSIDGTSIGEGIGGHTIRAADVSGDPVLTSVNVRQAFIQGVDTRTGGQGVVPNAASAISGYAAGPVRRYQVTLALGVMQQEKLIPTKYMAGQLAIEIELAPAAECIFATAAGTGAGPTYKVFNVNLIPEIINFSPAYDEQFLNGLRQGGVPIKFATWHTFQTSTQASRNINFSVHEKGRSVKSLFALQRAAPFTYTSDNGAAINSSNGIMQQYQWRVGGEYYPASPVQLSTTPSGAVSNGGVEAYTELTKALNIVGDYRLSSAVNTTRWHLRYPASGTGYNESDYEVSIHGFDADGVPTFVNGPVTGCGVLGAECFAAAISLETSNGSGISGLNASEQSDITFMATYSGDQKASYQIIVFSYIDKMMILRDGGNMELIE